MERCLSSQRLVLRLFRTADSNDMAFLTALFTCPREVAVHKQQWLPEDVPVLVRSAPFLFAICLQRSSALTGYVLITRGAVFEMVLEESVQRKGVSVEASILVIDHFFAQNPSTRSLKTFIHPANGVSYRSAEKFGWAFGGTDNEGWMDFTLERAAYSRSELIASLRRRFGVTSSSTEEVLQTTG